MKEIKINRLVLENFKCHAFLNLCFEGESRSIYGDNATGKTSVYDALVWALFGKDSMGNGEKNIDIKPLNPNGEVRDHQAITSVEVEFLVDGEIVTFKRTFREIWATRRGTGVPVYEGNTSDYFVNGVPMKKNAYDAAIKDLVSEELFRILTSVSYFAAGMKWQERRAVLFDMAGALTDREIMASDVRFVPLMDSLGKLSLSEYKAKLTHEKKGLTGIRDDTPTRINECQRTVDQLAGLDFARAKEDAEELEAEQERIGAQLLAIEHDNAAEQKRMEIRQAQMELNALEKENDLFHRSQATQGTNPESLKRELRMAQNRLSNTKSLMESMEKYVAGCDRQIDASREKWIRINSEVFTGGNCSMCGQALPADKLSAAMSRFENHKKQKLEDTERTANEQKMAKIQGEEQIRQYQEDISRLEAQIRELESGVAEAENAVVVPVDMEDYAQRAKAIKDRINELSGELFELTQNTSSAKEALRQKLNTIRAKRSEKLAIISKESILSYSRQRIEGLKADAKNAAEALENIEKMLYMMEEFTRYKAKFVEGSINSLFRIATFRLFREQANGGLEERCDAQYDGVPFMGLNNGMKVNVGIDIINALSRHYGVTVPLFVDNAEAVTRLEPCDAQVIRLVVSEEDKELRMV